MTLFLFLFVIVAFLFVGFYAFQLLIMPAFWVLAAIVLTVYWIGWSGLFISLFLIFLALMLIWGIVEG